MEALLAGLASLLAWDTALYIVLGVMIGFVIGVVPGLGGAIALALMIPFTFDMSATNAFAFLLAMATVTGTTGDVTSILYGVPGEPTSAASIIDGFAMTKKGEGGRALGASLSSSAIGAIFGALTIVISIPVVRPLVLTFGAPEFFAVIVLGLSMVSILGRGSGFKGLLAAMCGMLLATIGLDPNTGTPRFTAGVVELWDGLGLVPMAIGLFAIPEMLGLAVRSTGIARGVVGSVVGIKQGIRDTFRHFGLTIRSSAIGAFLGLLPGLGGSVSQWMAYAHAVQTSPRYDEDGNERFGRGAIEGVIGPGAANNSKDGGSIIPTVAFGIPGSVTTAILLGAFLIHGLVPGRQMLTTELALTMSFVSVIIIANLLAVGLTLLLLRPMLRITQLRTGIVLPPLLFLVYLGAFTSNNQIASVAIMLSMGALGLLMVMTKWPRPPLILGFVLGPLAENYFSIATARYGMSWLYSPTVLAIAFITMLFIGYSIVQNRRTRGSIGRRPEPPGSATA